MKKIISLFKRDYEKTRLVYNEIVPGAEWVQKGLGMATIKHDGTCCMIFDEKIFKRHDRKRIKKSNSRIINIEDYKKAPLNWIPCEDKPDPNSGHWPGWLPVGDEPDSKWHREAFLECVTNEVKLPSGTYELVGPKIQGNPYKLNKHYLWKHDLFILKNVPTDFEGLKKYLEKRWMEGIVWHHENRVEMVKIKRKDFGIKWP